MSATAKVYLQRKDRPLTFADPSFEALHAKYVDPEVSVLDGKLTDGARVCVDVTQIVSVVECLPERIDGLSDDQNNAVASLEAGNDLSHAVTLTNPAFVSAYLQSRAHDEIAGGSALRAVLMDERVVEILPYEHGPDSIAVRAGSPETEPVLLPLVQVKHLVEVGSGGDTQA